MRHARISISPGEVLLAACDGIRKDRLIASVDDALRCVSEQIGGLSTTEPELRRLWVGRSALWCYRVRVLDVTAAEPLAEELRTRQFRVEVDRAKIQFFGS